MLLDVLETHLIVRLVTRARLILVGSKVLNLLATVFDFCQTERCGRAFEEVAKS